MKKLTLEELINIAYDVDKKFYGEKDPFDLIDKLKEEADELKIALTQDDFEASKELGDVLFCLISLAKQNNICIQSALMLTVTKIQERIKHGVKNGR